MGRPRDLDARDRILQSTVDLVCTPGADSSINAIVRRAGVGKATVYRWWGSRTGLVLDALRQQRQALDLVPDDPVAEVRAVLADLAALLSPPHRAMVRDLLAAVMRDEPESPEILAAIHASHRDALRDALGRVGERGGLAPGVTAEGAADALLGPLWLEVLVDGGDCGRGVREIVDELMATVGRCLLRQPAA